MKTAGVALAAGALLLAVSGCGRASNANLVEGKTLFVGKGTCGSCHTLSHANTHGTVGPDLDAAFANARRDGLGVSAIEGVVLGQIDHPRKGSAMPAKLVTGQKARDVAAYVAAVAAVPGQDAGLLALAGTPNNTNKTALEQGTKLTIPADPTGALAYDFGKAVAKPGMVTISMPNMSSLQHNIAISGPVNGNGAVVGHGGTSSFTVSLKPGTYKFFCQVDGHDAAGMHGTLTVK